MLNSNMFLCMDNYFSVQVYKHEYLPYMYMCVCTMVRASYMDNSYEAANVVVVHNSRLGLVNDI